MLLVFFFLTACFGCAVCLVVHLLNALVRILSCQQLTFKEKNRGAEMSFVGNNGALPPTFLSTVARLVGDALSDAYDQATDKIAFVANTAIDTVEKATPVLKWDPMDLLTTSQSSTNSGMGCERFEGSFQGL